MIGVWIQVSLEVLQADRCVNSGKGSTLIARLGESFRGAHAIRGLPLMFQGRVGLNTGGEPLAIRSDRPTEVRMRGSKQRG